VVTKSIQFCLFALVAVSTGCVSTDPIAYQGIASSKQLSVNTQNKDGKIPLIYSHGTVDFSAYSAIIVEPVEIYRNRDNQFGSITEKDKVELASYMQRSFEGRLRPKYALTKIPGPGTLRLKLELTGAKTNAVVISTVAKLMPMGLAVNGLQAARGKEGTLSGSINYSVEVYDSASNNLLLAYVSKQYPSALDVGASLGPLGASKVGIDKGADALLSNLQPKLPIAAR
jgi:hypothetical protein